MTKLILATMLSITLLLSGCTQRAFGGSSIRNDVRDSVDYNSGSKNNISVILPTPNKFKDEYSNSKKQELIYTALWDLRKKVSKISDKETSIEFSQFISVIVGNNIVNKMVYDKWIGGKYKRRNRKKIEGTNFIASYKMCKKYSKILMHDSCKLFYKNRLDIEVYLIKHKKLEKDWETNK